MKVEFAEGEFLSPEDIKELHDDIIDESGLHDDKGYIDETGALFESAYYSMFTSFGGIDKYPDIEDKAARLCYAIITSHCFRNANKRTGLMSMILTLEMNGKKHQFDQEAIYDIILRLGSGTATLEELIEFVKQDQKA